MTERLYDSDSYLSEFTCKVVNLYSDDKYFYIETDRTAFFPEGGGQTSDIGTLGDCYVENVQIEEGKIIHFVEKSDENVESLEIGMEICGKIDMKKRFSDMQQHTGEHIFSGIVNSLYGYNNVGFHLGSEVVTLDFDGTLTEEDMCKVENLVNKAVWDNLPINVMFPDDEQLSQIKYRSKIEIKEQVRIVEIPGVDVCACCAPHVKSTGEIGIIEVVNFEKYKKGTRVSILCGERALKDIRAKLNENRKISALTCAKQKETARAVERLKQENENLIYEITGLNREILSSMADTIDPQDKIITFDKRLDCKLLSDFTISLMGKAGKFASSFCGENESYRYCIASNNVDLRPLSKAINEAFSGRGGGKPEIVQGSLCGTQTEIEKFLNEYEI